MYTSIYGVPTGRYPREVAWLKRLHRDGALICSVCSGALLIAETGLLNGHRATAHWAYRDMFERNYPKIDFRHESVLCLEAEDYRLITAVLGSTWTALPVDLIVTYCGYPRPLTPAN